jgi:protein tyrosine phosphatase
MLLNLVIIFLTKGTFIAIYTLIEMLKETSYFNAKKLVIEMRKQRAFLVQNWESLNFPLLL